MINEFFPVVAKDVYVAQIALQAARQANNEAIKERKRAERVITRYEQNCNGELVLEMLAKAVTGSEDEAQAYLTQIKKSKHEDEVSK
jgi:hypothetical protein